MRAHRTSVSKTDRPRFIVSPLNERDPGLGRAPKPEEIAHVLGDRLGKNWPFQRGYIDTQFVAGELGDSGRIRLLTMAKSVNPKLIPICSLDDLKSGFVKALMGIGHRVALIIPYETDADDLRAAMKQSSVSAKDTVVFVDFHGAPLSEDFGPNVAGVLEEIYSASPFSRIIFQGSAYPEKLPVGANESIRISRGEWAAFQSCLKELNLPLNKIAYGDYAADTSKIVFKKAGGGRPRPHLRFTTADHTFVVRGSDEGSFKDSMRAVCAKIVESGDYLGRGYSYADDLIWKFANRKTQTCGNPSTWRELNTAHHIAVVVRAIGEASGITFSAREYAKDDVQGSLF